MNESHGDLQALLGLLEGHASAAEGAGLRERLAEESELRRRWQRLRLSAEALDRSDVRADEPAVDEETLAALLDGRLGGDEARAAETAVWESEATLAEAISAYRFARVERRAALRPSATARHLALFPASNDSASDADVVKTDRRERRRRELDAVRPAPVPRAERTAPPPVVTSRSRRRASSEPRPQWRVLIGLLVVVCGIALVAVLIGRRDDRNDAPPVANDSDRAPRETPDVGPVVKDDVVDSPNDTIPETAPIVTAVDVVGAVFVRRDSSAWILASGTTKVDGRVDLLVPDSSWARLTYGDTELVLAGPTEVILPKPPEAKMRSVELVRGRLGVNSPSGGAPLSITTSSGNTPVSTGSDGVECSLTVAGEEVVLQLHGGSIDVGDRIVQGPVVLSAAAERDWGRTADDVIAATWRSRPADNPVATRLAARTRDSQDVVGTLLSDSAAVSPLAARWSLELDPARTITELAHRAEDDPADTLLFAIADRPPTDPLTRRTWRILAERLGDDRLAELLASWHGIASSRAPFDVEAARELVRGLGHEQVLVRSAAIRTLRAATGDRLGYDPRGTPAERTRAVRAWTMELRRRFPGGRPADPPTRRPRMR